MNRRRFFRAIRNWPSTFWWAIQARAIGLYHLLRGHDLRWREDANPWCGNFGFIVCHDCPDTDGRVGLVIYARSWSWWMKAAMKVCGWLGHPGETPVREWKGKNEEMVFEDIPGLTGCTRCWAEFGDRLEEKGTRP